MCSHLLLLLLRYNNTDVLQDFIKVANKKDTHAPKYGVLESKALDAAAVEAISQLPTKTELYRRIAVGVNSVPQKIARGITVSFNDIAAITTAASASASASATSSTSSGMLGAVARSIRFYTVCVFSVSMV
jgi:ribosomal protein L10